MADEDNIENPLTGTTPESEAPKEGAEGAAPEGEEGGTGKAESEEGTAPEGEKPEGKATPKEKPWFQKRFDKMTAEKLELQEKAEQLTQQNADLIEKMGRGEKLTRDEQKSLDQRVEERANEKIHAQKFNTRCDSIFDEGVKDYPDFKESIDNLRVLGATDVKNNPGFLNAVIELDSAHKVLHHLGKNPEITEKIMAMAPAKMAIELARVEASLTKPKEKPVSKVPEPIKPLGANNAKKAPDLNDNDLPIDKWIEERNKQAEARKRR